MPVVTASGTLDMTLMTRDLLVQMLAQGTVLAATATRYEVEYNINGYTVRHVFEGTDFIYPAGGGAPTAGAITSYALLDFDGDPVLAITGLTISFGQLNSALADSNPQVFLDLIFGGGDIITGGDDIGPGDIINGHGGDDQISGGANGGDTLSGGAGNDTITGGDEDVTGHPAPSYDGIDGGDGDDVLSGGTGNDVIVGGSGADQINGDAGNDLLLGYGGAITYTTTTVPYTPPFQNYEIYVDVRTHQPTDRLSDDGAADTLNGGDGDDTIIAGLNDIVDGGAGNDLLDLTFIGRNSGLTLDMTGGLTALGAASGGSFVNVERVIVRGSNHADAVTGSATADTIYGGEGGDTISGGGGNDTLFGATYAHNQLIGPLAGHNFDDGDIDTLSGGEGNDTLVVGLRDIADGGAGTDILHLTLAGLDHGVNLDLTVGDRWATLATASGGTLTGFETLSYLSTTDFEDTVRLNGTGSFYLHAGNDTFYGDVAVQFVGGEEGNDTIYTYGGNDRIWGGAGDDVVYAGDGIDYIYADLNNNANASTPTPGNDYLDGGAGNDFLYGGGGDDIIVTGAGADQGEGGDGFDTLDYSASTSSITMNVETAFGPFNEPYTVVVGTAGDSLGDRFSGIERVIGTAFNDVISNVFDAVGGAGNDTITLRHSSSRLDGGEGNDTLTAAYGNDTLLGGAGDDILFGGEGNDMIDGGEGNDTLSYGDFYSVGRGMTVDLRLSGPQASGGPAGQDTLTSVENLNGTNGGDTFHGNDEANILRGGLNGSTSTVYPDGTVVPNYFDYLYGHGGDDQLFGDWAEEQTAGTVYDGAVDFLYGGDGDDLAHGGAGNDNVYGENGDDRLYGDGGDDQVFGGDGDDLMYGGVGNDRLDGGAGSDTISYRDAASGVTVKLGLTGWALTTGEGADTLISIERFEGSAFGDTITIDASMGWPELITLGAGADHIAFTGAFVTPGGGRTINIANFQGGQGGDVLDLSAWLTSGAFPGYVAGTNPFTTGLLSFSEYDNGPNDYRIELNVRDANGMMQPFLTFRDVRSSDLSSANIGFPLPFLRTDGTQNNDAMAGAADNDVMNGLGGFDQMAGFAGDDQLSGGDGDDIIFGDSWRANQAGAGDDVISGGAGADFLIGGGGDDILDGGDGDDLLYGGVMTGGDTRFIPGYIGLVEIDHSKDSGADTFIGGAGNDRAYLVYSSATGAVVIDNSNTGNVNAIQIGGQAHGSITGVESVDIYGGSANDILTAGAGADYLFGNAGNDILTGGGGDDILTGGSGADQLHGGAGIDVANYADATAGVTVDLALQGVTITTGGAAGDVLTGIEGLTGSAFSDVLRGDSGANILIDLLGGDDVIEGRDGNDVIGVDHSADELDDSQVLVDGGDGDDVIGVTGVGAGSTILGGAGRDDITLEYRTGAVTIDAGSGDDRVTLDVNQAGAAVTLGSGRDLLTLTGSSAGTQTQTITDFDVGPQGDRIELGEWTYQGINPFAVPNTLRIIQSGADTLLQVWNGGWVNALVLQNVQASSLNASHFRGYNPHPSNYTQISGTFESNTLTGTTGNDEIGGVAGSDALRGGAGNDVIVAGEPAYIQLAGWGSGLDGGAGDDVLRGASTNDFMVGNIGADVLFGGRGNDFMAGGGGGFTSTAQTQTLFGQPMTVLIHGLITPALDDGEVDYLYGEDGDDTLYAGRGDFAFGGSGADRLVTSLAWRSSGVTLDLSTITSADLSAIADATLDEFELFSLELTAFNDTVTTGAGNDVLDGGDGDDVLTGGAGLNTLTGGAGADTLRGGLGNDSLTGGRYGFSSLIQQIDGSYRSGSKLDDGAVDIVEGGEGNDSIFVGYGDIADGGAGTDTLALTLIARTSGVNLDLTSDAQARLAAVQGGSLTGFENFTSIHLTNYDDILRVGGSGNFYAGAGDDQIYGNDLVQFMGGDEGNDRLEAFGGNDRLWGGAGDDILLGGDGSDVLEGDANNDNGLNPPAVGNDYLDGGTGIDTLNGGAGDDTLIGGLGNDTINGGVGTDTAIFNGARSAYTITTVTGGAVRVVGPDGTDTLTGVERLRFSDGLYDSLGVTRLNEVAGTTAADTLAGSSGIDVITAGAGDDVINAGGGDDLITGGAGDDVIDGGDGVDTLFVQGTRADTRVIVRGDGFLLKSLDGGDRLVNVELIRFSDGGIIDLRIQSGPDGWGAFVDGQKGGDAPLVLPSVGDKGIDSGPQVLPGADDFLLSDDTSVPPAFAGKGVDDGPWVLPGDEVFSGRPHFFSEDHGLIVMGPHGPVLLEAQPLHSDTPHDPWA